MAHAEFKVGDLTAVIGDNEAHGEHHAGYNGLWRLTHLSEPTNLFVPTVAGLNLEHVFDGDKELSDVDGARKVFFEPRNAPMEFRKISDAEAELHQDPTPTFKVESWTRFRLVAPHYIDFEFRCKPTQHVFNHGYIGLFWASYINAPDDKSMYLRDGGQWQQLCTPAHNNQSTVRHRDDQFELKFRENSGDALFKNFSPLRYDEPFFYGLFRNHLFAVMFEKPDGIRFTHSPSGGGSNAAAQTTNPAWDFQFIIPRYEVMREYSFSARTLYRERCPRAELLAEYERWKKSLPK